MGRYIIYGAGGIGGAIGASLHQHGFDVTLIARGRHLAAMQRDGLRLRQPGGDAVIRVHAVAHPREITYAPGDVVIFTMKSQDTAEALFALREAAGSRIPVVMCQNGVANESMAARLFTDVYAMLVYMPTTHLEPGVVIAESKTVIGVLDAGCYPRGIDDTITSVCDALRRANFHAEPDPQVMRLKYAKLLVNLGNAVQGLLGLEADTKAIGKALRAEAIACFDAAGIDYMTVPDMRAQHAGLIEMGEVAGVSRGGGSTWQSVMRGTGSIEADYLNGEIVLLGKQFSIPTPYNAALRDLSVAAAKRGDTPGGMTPDEFMAHLEQYHGST
ncbi:MAG: 2-dehydropantoate 2-reductase N-terminal domain-containing protein [Pseudomonadota bacterium]